MRQSSRIAISVTILSLVQCICALAQTKLTLQHPPECSIKATYTYPNKECTITYYRDKPAITNAYTVPPGTTIYLRIISQHPFETPSTKITTTQLPPLDVFGSIVKNFASPISVLTVKSGVGKLLDMATPQGSIEHDELALKLKLDDVTTLFNHAKASITCLQTARAAVADLTCVPLATSPPDDQAIRDALTSVTSELAIAALQTIPARPELAPIQAKIDARLAVCRALPETNDAEKSIKNECLAEMQRAQLNILNLGLGMDASASTQKSLTSLYDTLRSISYKPKPDIVFSYKTEANHSDVVKTSVVDALTATSADVASTTINAQYSRVAISTGVMFSTLKNQTFANAPIIVNGQPTLDATGKVLNQVVVNTTRPSVVFPLILLDYRVHSFSKGCKGNCSFLLGGGVGANLSSKTADLAIGPSFQYGSVLVSPIFHYGRQTHLTNGVAVGQQLGTSPPTLPTNNFWTPAFGFSIGYIIPLGTLNSSGSSK